MRKLSWLLLLVAVAAAACQPLTQPTPPAGTVPAATATPLATATSLAPATPAEAGANPLAGTQWRLLSIDAPDAETPITGESIPTLDFAADGTVSGQGGCNSFGGSYEATGDQIVVQEIISTLMACTDELVMEQEQRYLETLPTMTQFRLADDQSTLTLLNASGDVFLNFERMSG